MKENAVFFKRFLKGRGKIGSVLPSSTFLAREMVKMLPFRDVHTIVELGGGTGVITKSIVRNKKEETRLIIFEPDEQFFQLLKKKFRSEKTVTIVRNSAENLRDVLESLRFSFSDCVVSSLPFVSFGKRTSSKILNEIRKNLAPHGRFILYQYTPFMLPLILKYFKVEKFSFVPFNVPPALVLCCVSRR